MDENVLYLSCGEDLDNGLDSKYGCTHHSDYQIDVLSSAIAHSPQGSSFQSLSPTHTKTALT